MARKGHYDLGKEQRWRRLLTDWQRSDLAIRAFCSRQGISEASFHAWRKTLAERDGKSIPRRRHGQQQADRRAAMRAKPRRRQSMASSFLPVQIVNEQASFLEIVCPSGHRLRLGTGVSPQTLTEVLAVLEGRPC
jgi:hypothetical protein